MRGGGAGDRQRGQPPPDAQRTPCRVFAPSAAPPPHPPQPAEYRPCPRTQCSANTLIPPLGRSGLRPRPPPPKISPSVRVFTGKHSRSEIRRFWGDCFSLQRAGRAAKSSPFSAFLRRNLLGRCYRWLYKEAPGVAQAVSWRPGVCLRFFCDRCCHCHLVRRTSGGLAAAGVGAGGLLARRGGRAAELLSHPGPSCGIALRRTAT